MTTSRAPADTQLQLRISREFQCLKDALFQGGITDETLDLLISSAHQDNLRKDSGIDAINPWNQDFPDQMNGAPASSHFNITTPFQGMPWRSNAQAPTFNLAPGSGPFRNGSSQPGQGHLRVPNLQRQVSYGISSVPEDTAFADDADFDESHCFQSDFPGVPTTSEKRTLYFNGLSDRTSYRDLLSVVKGGKILSVNMRNERAATVTFLDGAADFLIWAKRNDIYLHAKRVSSIF